MLIFANWKSEQGQESSTVGRELKVVSDITTLAPWRMQQELPTLAHKNLLF